MIKIPISSRTTTLSKVLDKVIAEYKPPGKLIGKLEENPKLSEVDLAEARRKGDVIIAPDVYAYYLEKFNEPPVKVAAAGLFPKSKLLSISGRFHYPPKGFMGWHTNSNMAGWRAYATWCEEGDKSFFRYFDKNKMVTEQEKQGWNFRAFKVTKEKLYWHCVYTETNRFSFGFRFEL